MTQHGYDPSSAPPGSHPQKMRAFILSASLGVSAPF